MLTAKIVLISTLSILFPSGSYENQISGGHTTQSIVNLLKTTGNKPIPLERKANVTSENEARNPSAPQVTEAPLSDPSTIYETVNSTNNLLTVSNSEVTRRTSTFSTVPPLAHDFVSRLPLNSSTADENLGQVSAHPASTQSLSLENLTWVLDNDTIKSPDSISSTVTILAPGSPTTPVTPLTVEPTGWLTTNSDNFAGFTPYREKTTLQTTLIFTNNSKLFPNTSDPQKENKGTGIVFGAILGAILGASLLSLVGYLLCGKRKTDSFSHRRLYDDRNEPVLRLDNAPEPYDVNFGNSSYYNSAVSDSSMTEGGENMHEGIPMDDIPPIHTSI